MKVTNEIRQLIILSAFAQTPKRNGRDAALLDCLHCIPR